MIKLFKIPAPAPLEQRWTASSIACMSPAYSSKKDVVIADTSEVRVEVNAGTVKADINAAITARDTVHAWLGIIQYLPMRDTPQREAIEASFSSYVKSVMQLAPTVHIFPGYPGTNTHSTFVPRYCYPHILGNNTLLPRALIPSYSGGHEYPRTPDC